MRIAEWNLDFFSLKEKDGMGHFVPHKYVFGKWYTRTREKNSVTFHNGAFSYGLYKVILQTRCMSQKVAKVCNVLNYQLMLFGIQLPITAFFLFPFKVDIYLFFQ